MPFFKRLLFHLPTFPLSHLRLVAFLLLLTFSLSHLQTFAAPAPAPAKSAPVSVLSIIKAEPDLFRAGEVSVDFGSYARTRDFGTFQRGTIADINWFPWRCAGFFAGGRLEDWHHSVIDAGEFGLIARYPLLHLAPQIQLGEQFDFERDKWSTFAALGAEVRLTRHTGIVVEVRGTRRNTADFGESAPKEDLAGIIKLRATF